MDPLIKPQPLPFTLEPPVTSSLASSPYADCPAKLESPVWPVANPLDRLTSTGGLVPVTSHPQRSLSPSRIAIVLPTASSGCLFRCCNEEQHLASQPFHHLEAPFPHSRISDTSSIQPQCSSHLNLTLSWPSGHNFFTPPTSLNQINNVGQKFLMPHVTPTISPKSYSFNL